MSVIPRLLFLLGLIVAPIVVWVTSAGLPASVASHFGVGGLANGWMPRGAYVALMLALVTVVPVAVVAMTGFLPQFATSRGMLADRDYWLAPGRRPATLAGLATHACWMGLALTLFMTGMHLLTVQANAQVPARLAEPSFFVLLSAFLVGTVVWVVALKARFRRPG